MSRLLAPLIALAVSACVGSAAMPSVQPGAPAFVPTVFFSGRTQGVGRLRVVLSRARDIRVTGQGRVGQDGVLTLVQTIEQQGSPDRVRTWSLRPTGAGIYEGTLSDAVGPVVAQADGNRLHIRFAAKGGVAIEQWIVLAPDGRTARNHLVARKLGIRVAVLDETILRVG